MATCTIREAAERSGFSASALRYYEGIGLVGPATRSSAGYRLYDEHDLARLSLIRRAKELGCTLEEITDLVALWEGERCQPVRGRVHELVTARIAAMEQEVVELRARGERLRAAAVRLAGPTGGGPCDDGCGCLAVAPGAARPITEPAPGVPIACTLDAVALDHRMQAWQELLVQATGRVAAPGGVLRIELGTNPDLAGLADLVAAEQRCCAFLSFAITVDHRGVGLEVTAPAGAEQAVASLFGAAAA